MSFRYIGSKARVAEAIGQHLGSPDSNNGVFVDAFCGTGSVAEIASDIGWDVHLNDYLLSSVTMAAARFLSQEDVAFDFFGGYEEISRQLNNAKPVKGFIWKQYSPASSKEVGIERRYFTEENAKKIDAIRNQLLKWKNSGLLSDLEEKLLIADLLSATNRVANIAGTYGCFLSHWTPQAENILSLRPRELRKKSKSIKVSTKDACQLKVSNCDVVYLDPPYTKRQYASYYHILETITLGDSPKVDGVSGLRPWKDKASAFCYKTKALKAILNLINGLQSRRILLSYSNEGHIELEDLATSLQNEGNVSFIELKDVGRYRPNKTASKGGSAVKEYLIIIDRPEETKRKIVCA